MSENVIKFQRPQKPKPPRQTPPWMKRVIAIAAVAVFLVGAFIYFSLTGNPGIPAP